MKTQSFLAAVIAGLATATQVHATVVALSQALRQEAERLALRFAGGTAAEALLAATGADLARARNELAKLRAALGEGGFIDEASVGRYVAG